MPILQHKTFCKQSERIQESSEKMGECKEPLSGWVLGQLGSWGCLCSGQLCLVRTALKAHWNSCRASWAAPMATSTATS